jgi:hypothetical protein
MRAIRCEPAELLESALDVGKGVVECAAEASEFVIGLGICEALAECFGCNLARPKSNIFNWHQSAPGYRMARNPGNHQDHG